MIQAISKSVRVSPRKIRLVAQLIRNRKVQDAISLLATAQKRAAGPLEKTLHSAIANAVNNKKVDKNSLYISRVEVTEGSPLKRYHPSTRGRVHPYKKRSSHIRVILEEKEEAHGTKS